VARGLARGRPGWQWASSGARVSISGSGTVETPGRGGVVGSGEGGPGRPSEGRRRPKLAP
jgi:hypothetical protein